MKKTIFPLGILCIVLILTSFTAYAQTSLCYNNATGSMRVLLPPSSKCRPSETLVQIPRVVHGQVVDGQILSGTGFSVYYDYLPLNPAVITFDPPFTKTPDCVVSSSSPWYDCYQTWINDPPSLQVSCWYGVNADADSESLLITYKFGAGPYSFVCIEE